MSWSYHDTDRGYMLSTLTDPWLLYPLAAALVGWRRALSWVHWGQTVGIMVKLKDSVAGELLWDGRISKPMTPEDQLRLAHGVAVARRVLIAAGADPDSIFVSPPRGTHPSATIRIGEIVDHDLQSSLAGLYVCDASVFPEALGQPTVLTILALGKRLSERLKNRELASAVRSRPSTAAPAVGPNEGP